MSLRQRFALYAALVVALTLGAGGLALRQALEFGLLRQAERELETLLRLAAGAVAEGEKAAELQLDEGLLTALLPNTLLLLLGPEGLMDAVGFLPPLEVLEALARGERGGYLVREEGLGGLRLLAARELGELREVLALLDRILLPTLLLGALLATGLAMGLAGEALKPLSQATRAALNLARERAWQRRLPSPQGRDEVGELVEAFNQVLAALEEALAAERRFAQEAAHALRTPLTLLLGELERGRLAEARTQVERLRELVERLLLLARAEAGTLERSPLALDGLVFEETEALRPAFRARDLRLEVELPEEPAWVLAHPAALRAAVVSLLENALEHTARGGWVRVRVDGEELLVENGPGRPRPGTGLGLRLATSLTQAQGGSLRWEGGPTFRVALRLPPPP